HLRRAFEELMATLPQEHGGGPGTVVTRGLSWATLGMDVPPKSKLRLIIQARDAAAAQAFQRVLANLSKVNEQRVPLFRPFLNFEKLAPLLHPEVAGDRLVLTRDDQSGETASLLTSLLRFGLVGHGEQRKQSLRQLAIVFHAYNDTYGHIPPAVFRDKQGK